MREFTVGSIDWDLDEARPVFAPTPEEAITKYLREIESKEEIFRDHVLDLAVNMSFVEKFYLSSPQEHARFDQTGKVGTDIEIIKSRVRLFFGLRPDLGEIFVEYMDTADKALITDDVFEFIATNDEGWARGFVARPKDA